MVIIEYARIVNVSLVTLCGGQWNRNLCWCAKLARHKQIIARTLCANSVKNITNFYVRARLVTGESVKKIIFGVRPSAVLTASVATVTRTRPTILRQLMVDGFVQSVVNLRRHRLTKREKIPRKGPSTTGSVAELQKLETEWQSLQTEVTNWRRLIEDARRAKRTSDRKWGHLQQSLL